MGKRKDGLSARQRKRIKKMARNEHIILEGCMPFIYKEKPVYSFFKRIFDIFCSGLALILLIPLFLCVFIAIKIDDRGPVIFAQDRVGKNGKVFKMHKFRSMCINAENQLADLQHLNEETGPLFKIKNDPRITRVGKIIRKTSIDELPQLWDIFVGHMSFVGPRPCITLEYVQYNEEDRRRSLVKPGLTCIWQVSGRSKLGFRCQMAMDAYYVKHRNAWMDIKLIFLTIPAVLMRDGAE